MTKIKNNTNNIAQDLLSFIKRSPTPFHATKNLVDVFTENGFTLLDEGEAWKVTKNGARCRGLWRRIITPMARP